MGRAADFISVLLQKNPLSQPSEAEPEQAAHESPAPQAAPNSPVARARQGSSASQAPAAPSPGAEPSSPPARGSPVTPAQTSAPLYRPPTTPAACPAACPMTVETAAKLNASPDWWRSLQQEGLYATDADARMPARWQTPSAATWKQISTISIRAVNALQWVSQQHTHCEGQTREMSPVAQAMTLMSAGLLTTKLRELLQQLLWGHFSDVTLDFQPILQAGLAPIVHLLDRGELYEKNVGLVVRCLERMTQDSIQGRLKEPIDDDACLQQLRSIFTLLGEPNCARN